MVTRRTPPGETAFTCADATETPWQRGRTACRLRQDDLQAEDRGRPDDQCAEELPAVATRFDKRAYVFHGTVTVAAIRLWLPSQPARHVLGAGPPVDELTHDIEVAVVAGRLLNEVEDHPPQVDMAAVADGTLGR